MDSIYEAVYWFLVTILSTGMASTEKNTPLYAFNFRESNTNKYYCEQKALFHIPVGE